MPPKKKKGGKKKAKGRKLIGHYTPAELVRKFHKTYEKNCVLGKSAIAQSLHNLMASCMENDNLMAKIILEPNPPSDVTPLVVILEPVVQTIRQERYSHIKDFHVWQLPVIHEHAAALALLVEKGICPFRHIELMDCLLAPQSVARLSMSFCTCVTLTRITLDYNEFGDAGCQGLCEGLMCNVSVTTLSLNYCGLTVASGRILGDIVATTAVRELYVDGNDLECEGAVELIRLVADNAALEAFEREEAARRKREEEEAMLREKQSYKSYSSGDEYQSRVGSAGKKKKKKKKGKKSKGPPPPPPVGPWLTKLHIADNGIDTLGNNGPYAPISCLRLFRKLITHSDCLEELDLEDNLVGDLGGYEILQALKDRDEAKLPSMKLRTTHRMNGDTFEELVKMGAGLKKKKKGKGKKKKK